MLTDTKIKAARPTDRPYKLGDGRGLVLIVQPTGARWWRFRYAWQGKERMLSLGVYPDVPLSLARERRDAARRDVAAGVDPSAKRQEEKTARADTFRAVAEDWLKGQNYSAVTLSKSRWIFDDLLYPIIGDEPIRALDAAKALRALRVIEARGHRESAHRARQRIGQVMRFAAADYGVRDVTVELRDALAPVDTTSRAAITEPKALGTLLAAVNDYHGHYVTRQYLRILARVVTRPGELRQARWSEVDLDRGLFTVPADRMKMRNEFLAPLSTQVVELFGHLHDLTGQGELCFPSYRPHRPISDAVPSLALKALGYASDVHTAHGFRTSFSTLMHERGYSSAVIELCLAHTDTNKVRAIYNRAVMMDERRELMQAWSDYCDELSCPS